MSDRSLSVIHGVVVETDLQFTLLELSRACHTDIDHLVILVEEGVLTPSGDSPQDWRFGGTTLRRARTALRLTHDLHLSASGTALVLDLLDQIETLRSRLRRTESR